MDSLSRSMERICRASPTSSTSSGPRGMGSRTSRSFRMRPGRGAITTTRLASTSASVTSWVTKTIVLCVSSHTRCSSSCMCRRVCASSEPKGSSISSTGESTASARASAARIFMPPDSSCGIAQS